MTLRGCSRQTVVNQGKLLGRFAAFCEGKQGIELTRQDGVDFLSSEQKRGLALNTLSTYSWILKGLYKRCGVDFSLTFKVPLELRGRVLGMDEIEKLILVWRTDVGSPKTFYLALATTYGLRRMELARVTSNDIDLENKRVLVRTGKGGRPRWHTVPPEVEKAIFGCSYLKSLNLVLMSKVFNQLWKGAFHSRGHGIGWHSIRRALVTQLTDKGVPELTIIRFMRWSSSMRGMGVLPIYYSRTDAEVDKLVLEQHPFLGFWQNSS